MASWCITAAGSNIHLLVPVPGNALAPDHIALSLMIFDVEQTEATVAVEALASPEKTASQDTVKTVSLVSDDN